MGLFISAISVESDEDEADERQDEREIDGGPAEDYLLIYEMSLKRGHQCATHNGHNEESGTE